MKKVCFITLMVLFISCVLFVSCNPNVTPVAPVDPEGTINRSLEKLEAGGKFELENVGEDTEINLSGFTLEDGVYIELVNSKGKAIKSTKGVNEEFIFVREDGSLVPIPDENGNIKMKGKDLGVGNGTKVIVNKLLHLNDDFVISQNEYEDEIKAGKRHMAEEYYYFNLRDSDLKSSEVVILTSGHGAHNVRLLQRGMLNWDIKGVLNMSSYKQSGFAINMYLHFADDFPTQQMAVYVLNPIDVKDLSESNAHVLDTKINVIEVRKQNSGKKVVIQFDNSVSSDLIKDIAFNELALNTNPRYFDGKNRDVCIIPEIDLDNKTITYHLGSFNEEFIFTLDWNETDYVPGSAKVYVANDSDWNDSKFTDISNITTEINIAAQPGKIMTWAFKSDKLYNIHVDNNLNPEVSREQNEEKTRMYFTDNVKGGGNGCLREFLFTTDSYGDIDEGTLFSGYIFIDCTEKTTSENIITLIDAEDLTIDCDHVVWDPASKAYKCTDPNCSKLYSTTFIDACKTNIFKGDYYDEDCNSFGVFKDIHRDTEGFKVESIRKLPQHGTGVGAVDGRRYEGIILTDGSESWIDFTFQEIIKESNGVKKIVCDVTSYVNTDNPVRVTYTMCNHNWQISGTIDANNHCEITCTHCNSTRVATVLTLTTKEEDGYKVYVNDAPIALFIPELGEYGFEDFDKTGTSYIDALPKELLGEDHQVQAYVYSKKFRYSIKIEGTDYSSTPNKRSEYTLSFDTNQ